MRSVVCHTHRESIVNEGFMLATRPKSHSSRSPAFRTRLMNILKRTVSWRALGMVSGLGALGLAVGLPLRAASAGAGMETAVAGLQTAGYQALEELEIEADGGFEAEVFDERQQAFEVLLDASGAIRSKRLEAQTSAEDRIELKVASRLLAWLSAEGYRAPTSISADDGHIEIEAEDKAGHGVDLDVEAKGDGFHILRVRRQSFIERLDDQIEKKLGG